jgi:hypothetical protein
VGGAREKDSASKLQRCGHGRTCMCVALRVRRPAFSLVRDTTEQRGAGGWGRRRAQFCDTRTRDGHDRHRPCWQRQHGPGRRYTHSSKRDAGRGRERERERDSGYRVENNGLTYVRTLNGCQWLRDTHSPTCAWWVGVGRHADGGGAGAEAAAQGQVVANVPAASDPRRPGEYMEVVRKSLRGAQSTSKGGTQV